MANGSKLFLKGIARGDEVGECINANEFQLEANGVVIFRFVGGPFVVTRRLFGLGFGFGLGFSLGVGLGLLPVAVAASWGHRDMVSVGGLFSLRK